MNQTAFVFCVFDKTDAEICQDATWVNLMRREPMKNFREVLSEDFLKKRHL